ncbi:MAG: GTP-binding protein [Nannocystaceae bacterium]
MFLNYATRELNCKIVYYGAGMAGKTTNLRYIHRRLRPERRTNLIELATEEERTIFFDFMPVQVGSIAGFRVRLHLYTVPGQIHYGASRRVILRGADGIVQVVDSQKNRLEANCESLEGLQRDLRAHGLNVPRVVQYNKRDIQDTLAIETLRRHVNPSNVPEQAATAASGFGVLDTLRLISRLVLREMRTRFE